MAFYFVELHSTSEDRQPGAWWFVPSPAGVPFARAW